MSKITSPDRAFKKSRLTLDTQRAFDNDYFLMGNPIFVKGMSLTAAVGGAVNLRNGITLAAAGIILILLVRLFGAAVGRRLSDKAKPMVYVVISGVLCVPVIIFLTMWNNANVLLCGIYLPIMIFDESVLMKGFSSTFTGSKRFIGETVKLSLGYGTAIILVGAVRELLACGCLLGYKVLPVSPVPAADTVPIGFIVVALLAALWGMIGVTVRKAVFGGEGNE